jgi:hypothetical protein
MRMVVAGLRRHLAVDQIAAAWKSIMAIMRLEQRGLHPLALAGLLALLQGHHDADVAA